MLYISTFDVQEDEIRGTVIPEEKLIGYYVEKAAAELGVFMVKKIPYTQDFRGQNAVKRTYENKIIAVPVDQWNEFKTGLFNVVKGNGILEKGVMELIRNIETK